MGAYHDGGAVIDVVERDFTLLQAVAQRMMRKASIVLLAREPLFLGSGNDAAFLDQRSGAVMIER